MGTQPKQVGVFKNEDFIMSIIWNINETKGTHTTIIIQQPWKRRNHSPIIDLILWTFPCPAGSVFIITIIILENFHRHWRWASGRDGLKAWTCGEVCSWKYWSGDSEQVGNLSSDFWRKSSPKKSAGGHVSVLLLLMRRWNQIQLSHNLYKT